MVTQRVSCYNREYTRKKLPILGMHATNFYTLDLEAKYSFMTLP